MKLILNFSINAAINFRCFFVSLKKSLSTTRSVEENEQLSFIVNQTIQYSSAKNVVKEFGIKQNVVAPND